MYLFFLLPRFVSSYTGEALTFTNWANGQPIVNNGKDCVMYKGLITGKWHVDSCEQQLGVICQAAELVPPLEDEGGNSKMV